MSFKQIQFWGGFDYIVDSWYLRRGMEEFHRLFKWGEGYNYICHRPPTIINNLGQDTRKIKWDGKKKTSKLGIFLYHYSFVFPKQVDEKAEYYRNAEWAKLDYTNWWADEVYYKFKHPYKAFININFPGWIERIDAEHPLQIQMLINDIITGRKDIKMRSTEDLKAITGSLRYRLAIRFLKLADPVAYFISLYYKSIKRKIKNILK